jgi:hypothetical protein
LLHKKISKMPPKGRPPKKKRNISGLKNQSGLSESPINQNMQDNLPDNDTDGDGGDDQPPNNLKDMAGSEQEDEPDSDFESDYEWNGLSSRELGKRLASQSCARD